MRRRVPALLLACLTAAPALAQNRPAPAPPPPAVQHDAEAPYDARLARLAEILGALSYLRPLCGIADESWRADMQAILDADTASEPTRRARMTAAFNRGYRAFAAIHTACSPAALAAEGRYRAEGATLVAEITSRFGN
ncbi:TIGR02301 family protein [Rhizobiaceae bacterium BDR2-2]|uniref:TIGR02301 family protein n=1 Tax=Ectorhizobium quercum TaxID=2965071 RepID=A0AAE3SWU2_9HYPH|nr:TIGR02301 family protein [Ectorhizobium quercum]MCX8999068.1 TIGR02301 family protein [Ectorhizobium quercum]